MPYTPVKAESTVIANYAYDIKVTPSVVKSIDESYHWVRGVNITIRNHKTASIQILTQQDINGYALITSTPPATRVGGTLSWTIDLNPDDITTIYYEWEHCWQHNSSSFFWFILSELLS
jgi:hypothetical protein